MPDLNFYELGSLTAANTVKFISQCLLLHQGPIRKFSVSGCTLTVTRKIGQWMLFLSKHDIEELNVHYGGKECYKFPSFLFDWKKLTCLKLTGCKLDLPTTFEGFLNLKILSLSIMMMDSNIERLISKSPLLESLSLYSSSGSNDMITISAPKIKNLFMHGHFKDICLAYSPLLVDMSLGLYYDHGDCNLIRVLGGASNLEKLTVESCFAHFKIGFNRGALSTTFNYLKVLTLSEFVLGERQGIPLVLELIISAPNLEKLVIKSNGYHYPPTKVDKDFWKKECPHVHGFVNLKVIEIADIFCKAPEIEFVKFLLLNSPVLEEMEIRTHERRQMIITRMLKKLPKLPRTSPQVAVTFHHG